MLTGNDKIVWHFVDESYRSSTGSGFELAGMRQLPVQTLFSEGVCLFLNDLSKKLMDGARTYPDIAALALFLRQGNITQLKRRYDCCTRLGRGVSFHIAPGNVPSNFAYTLAAGLLAGNACIVKVPTRKYPQVACIIDALHTVLDSPAHAALRPYLVLLGYDHEQSAVTQELSALCDVRVVWGGDETINKVRQIPLSPRAHEVVFPHRYSVGLLSARFINALDSRELETTCERLCNDALLFDQNACSSPRLLYWVGSDQHVREAQKRVWPVLAAAASTYQPPTLAAVDKLEAICRCALECEGARRVSSDGDVIARVTIREFSMDALECTCQGGFFLECRGNNPDALLLRSDSRLQTIVCVGFQPNEVAQRAVELGSRGGLRFVPPGRAVDFGLFWDGHDLPRALSRHIGCE